MFINVIIYAKLKSYIRRDPNMIFGESLEWPYGSGSSSEYSLL